MKILVNKIIVVILISVLISCNQKVEEKPELLLYCGITMVKPMSKLVDNFEKLHNCKITITQGGSEDLYMSLKESKVGDLYLPGSQYYREKHIGEDYLLDYVYIGFNQVALMVKKGNPKNISADLKNLADRNLSVSIGNYESCSIGKISKKILSKVGIYEEVFANSVFISADSRDMNRIFPSGEGI